ncbi:MAG TPA: hypothetical protein VFV38_42515 [Ktedonobacteraceae bacterium]|nr:hypothetical protein [Ktedonobacteraceae bacterium]
MANQERSLGGPMKTSNQLQTMAITYAEICQGKTPWVALGNFMNDWFDDAKELREQLVAEPIVLPSQPDREMLRWAGFCAASVEWLCARYKVPCSSWVSDPAFILVEPWFDDPCADQPEVREWLLHDMPEPFRWRNVYCGDRLFENKYEFVEQVRQPRREHHKQTDPHA